MAMRWRSSRQSPVADRFEAVHTAVLATAFEGWAALDEHSGHAGLDVGAAVSFVGTLRADNAGKPVAAMFLEHYPGMTERCLADLAATAKARWGLSAVLVQHRIGQVLPGQTLVAIGCWSGHRVEAFAACEWLIERLKHDVPFWKREQVPGGTRWVTSNTPGRDV